MPRHDAASPIAFDGDGTLTAASLAARAAALDAWLGDAAAVVCLCADRVHVAVTLLAGLLRARACVMPHDQIAETVRQLRQRYPGVTAVADADRSEAFDAVAIEPLLAGSGNGTPDPGTLGFRADQCAAHVFTSGSTGEPRVHEKPWGALVHSGTELGRRFGIGAGHSVVATVPGQHVYGLEASIMLPLMTGGILFPGQPLLPADIAVALTRTVAPRVLVSTPVQLRRLVDTTDLEFPAVAHVISATAPLDAALAQRIEQRLAAPVVEMYGSTETGLVATRRTLGGDIWEPIAGVAVMPDDTGCYVSAEHLPCPVHLGDRIEPRDDGRFRLASRSEDLVKVAGKRGSLDNIAGQLRSAPGVEDAAVFVPDSDAGSVQRPVAFVVAPHTSAATILDYLRTRLDPVFLPRPLVHIDALPRTATGKVTRATLERLYRERVRGDAQR